MSQTRTHQIVALFLVAMVVSIVLVSNGWAARAMAQDEIADQPLDEILPRAYIPMAAHAFCGGFFDSFGDPASGWPVGNHQLVDYGYENGEYRIVAKSDDYFFNFSAPACAREGYTIEVDGRWVGEPGESYGIVFGITGNFDSYYIFDISTTYQKFRLLYRGPNGWEEVVGQTPHQAIKGGNAINHLEVSTDGRLIVLEANDEPLAFPDLGKNVGPARAGLSSSSKQGQARSDARFDNYGSWAPAKDPGQPAMPVNDRPFGRDVHFDGPLAEGTLPSWDSAP